MNIKKILICFVILLITLASTLLIKTMLYPFKSIADLKDKAVILPINELAIKRLSAAVQIPTVSTVNYEDTDFAPFDQFKQFLQNSYPTVYQAMDTTTINKYGLVFHWKGKDASKKPILFLSHYDVVPINNYDFANPMPYPKPLFDLTGKEEQMTAYQNAWSYPPFSGAVTNGRIYGRGTLDMKSMLIGILEAAEQLIAKGYQPEQDIYFAFGHDEEVSGRQGALKIAAYFKEQNLSFDAVYDEGGFITTPGSVLSTIDKSIALVGVAEKGFLTLEITVNGTGGHSSMPPEKGSLVLASEIIQKLNTNQMDAIITEPIEGFLQNIGLAMGYPSRVAISNQWVLGSTLLHTLESNPASNALVRTTTALTMAHSSDAPNVLSASTTITVNFRILQGNTVDQVLNHVKQQCQGYDVAYNVVSAREPSNISKTTSTVYTKLSEVISKNYPNAIVSSYLSIGGTDSYKYEIVSNNVFRFMPVELNQFEQRVIHNDNESITIANYMRLIDHFKLLLQQ